MIGHRMSALPHAQLCGLSAHLGRQYGAGRSAAMGSAFHALCSGLEAKKWCGRLTDEELAEVRSWHKPAPFLCNGLTYQYETALVESEVRVDVDGRYTTDDARALTVGHPDMRWHGTTHAGRRLLIVGDIKRSHWTAKPDSLQLLAYAYAAAKADEATGLLEELPIVVVGVWSATDGTWRWAPELDLADPFVEARVWFQIKAAAEAGPDATTGDHCSSCYSRLHCKEWFAPLVDGLEGFREGERLTPEQAESWLLKIKAVEDTAERIKRNIQAQSREAGGFSRADGKRYLPTLQSGSVRFDAKEFAKDFPELHQSYQRQGSPFEKWMWRKP